MTGHSLAQSTPGDLSELSPERLYSTYLGGSGGEDGRGIAVDDRGNAYVTGGTTSADFPIVNAVQPALRGGGAFVAKLGRADDEKDKP